MAVYPDSVGIYYWNINTALTDISSDVVGDITGSWGIYGNSPIDRMSETGTLNFTLNNEDKKYSPDSASALPEWGKGAIIYLELVYDGLGYMRFYGRVDTLKIDSGIYGSRRVQVTAVDTMDAIAKFTILDPTIVTNKRASEIFPLIFNDFKQRPSNLLYDTGDNVFPAVFDNITPKTKAYSEINKVILSELGYFYLRMQKGGSEQLVFENASHRNGLVSLSTMPLPYSESGYLLQETGEYLLLETGEKIVLNEVEAVEIDNKMQSLNLEYGKNIFNRFEIKAYPKKVDTSPQVLFSLNSPYLLSPNMTQSLKGRFRDPIASDTQVNGINMIAPVATTDYLMNTKEDGTGTNITADLTVTATYTSDGVVYELWNNNIQAGYITKLQARGYGIYAYDPITSSVSNDDSVIAYAENTLVIDQKYQTNLVKGNLASQTFLNEYKEPKTEVAKVNLLANTDGKLMQAFFWTDIGSLISLKETQSGIDGWFYIQNISFSISPGGIIKYSWGLKETYTLTKGLSLIELELSNRYDAVNYGYIPRVTNLTRRTYCGWFLRNSATETKATYFMSASDSDYAGTILYPSYEGDRRVKVYTRNQGGIGRWMTGTNKWDVGTWCFVAMTRDTSSNAQIPPLIYVNGVLQSLTEEYTPGTPVLDETGGFLMLGNAKTPSIDYDRTLFGSLKDCRIYNRVLTQEEIQSIYNYGAAGSYNDGITEGLVFRGPAVFTKDLDYFEDRVLTNVDRLMDATYYVIGTPNNSPETHLI